MKTAIAFALVGSAAAFAPAPLARSSTSLAGDARSLDGLGVDPGPLNLFNPLGLLEDTDGFIDLAGEVPFSSIGYGFDSNRGEGRRRCGGPGGRPGSPSLLVFCLALCAPSCPCLPLGRASG